MNALDSPIPEEYVHLVETLNQCPVTAIEVERWAKIDPVLAVVACYVAQGWPTKPEQETLEYFRVKDQLSLHGGCVLRGSRVVVPVAGRKIFTTGSAQRASRDDENEEPGKVICVVARNGF